MVAAADVPATVLVVEDDRELADLFASWLSEAYEVQTAYSGQEAIDRFDATIDVVLLDRLMPTVSGDEVLTSIRSRDDRCPVVMVTAVEPDFDIVDMGFDSYLTKPVTHDELEATVERMLTHREFDDEHRTYYRLLARRAALEREKSEDALAASEEFTRLEERIDALESTLGETLAGFEDEDYRAMFRSL